VPLLRISRTLDSGTRELCVLTHTTREGVFITVLSEVRKAEGLGLIAFSERKVRQRSGMGLARAGDLYVSDPYLAYNLFWPLPI